ncbi:hypothetical protein A5784_10575 [Mycobacterium sp. 852013-50091_SCH5140682]|uniref:hypothetical protein n=1 Tax=Mycobacterium sp. 852013-50091_SCH5140682 TaxID=1834109 RepID=UPI0007EBC63B|nr:hypothetical protein [Mycobacterium sp. 852013-50091_SCH5140682]OBC05820.1 hypothetical protein A5784_10575 [Mycobacterium sp. 852013-50091_SCH5140682]
MSPTKYAGLTAAALAGLLFGAQLIPAAAGADPDSPPQPSAVPQPDQQLHNATYRARIDGVSRNAMVSYKIDDNNINSANPTMLPGRVFEATGVVSNPQLAGMTVSIDWPYSANLHCEILVDDQIVAQADTWVAPRLTRPHDDPNYGSLACGAPLSNGASTGPADAAVPPPAAVEPPPAG